MSMEKASPHVNSARLTDFNSARLTDFIGMSDCVRVMGKLFYMRRTLSNITSHTDPLCPLHMSIPTVYRWAKIRRILRLKLLMEGV